jgi:hypothetical protein
MTDETTITTKPNGDSRMLGISVRAWLAIILVVTVCIMAGCGTEVKEPLYSVVIMAVSFYFGQKTQTPKP